MRLLAPLAYLADLALPPRCPGCGTVASADHRFCALCWGQLHFLTPPWCARCNLPFAFDRGADACCADCLAAPPKHQGIRAAVAYGDIARAMVLRLKYGGRTGFAETAARHMARLMPDDADVIVPVPLHRWRLWSRGFNQAALIGQALERLTGKPCDVDVLTRPRATPMLRGLGKRARAKAVSGAFAIAPASRNRVHGKAIVLVDDVHTSGATTDACTAQLLRAGAASVTILCWARVLQDDSRD
ncbi:ComF family protein [Sphingomonas sp. 32-62-10]|uniref:ComF family protein n=1 Tax=Sphingomonas sp. 32-62-10 TaxID=1970436 RepID=UPI000BD15122|nr:MAG: amidophosphoribosyltransferase [Sphingomonas sp. 32-62-10]